MTRAPFLRLVHKRKQDVLKEDMVKEIKCPACDGSGSCLHQTFNDSHKGYKLESSICLRCEGRRYLKKEKSQGQQVNS